MTSTETIAEQLRLVKHRLEQDDYESMTAIEEAIERLEELKAALFFQRGQAIGAVNFLTRQLREFGELEL
jgi:hypothetical protein